MNYYKLVRGYDAEQYIEINETELEKAEYAFLMKKDAVYSGGAIKGSDISMIQPDYHRMMGWNRGHKLNDYDYAELGQKGLDKKMRDQLALNKEKVQYLINSKQEHLIGKNIDIKALPDTFEN